VPRLPRLILLAGGLAATAIVVTAAVLGATASAWIFSLLPPVAIDAAAVGGAVSALGFGVLAVGLAQLGLALAIGRRSRWAMATATALGALLCATFVSLAVAAFTSAASAGLPWLMLAGAGLVLVAAGYGVACVVLVRASAASAGVRPTRGAPR
jgi:hypothetical protein